MDSFSVGTSEGFLEEKKLVFKTVIQNSSKLKTGVITVYSLSCIESNPLPSTVFPKVMVIISFDSCILFSYVAHILNSKDPYLGM